MAKFCIKCGSLLTPGTKFCTKCGEPVKMSKQVWDCLICGRVGNSGKFCTQCGASKPEPTKTSAALPIAAEPVRTYKEPTPAPISPEPISKPEPNPVPQPAPPSPEPVPAPTLEPVNEAESEPQEEQPTPQEEQGEPSEPSARRGGFAMPPMKKLLVPALLILVAVGALAATVGMDYLYDYRCEKSLFVMTESKELFDGFADLSGDFAADDVKEMAAAFEKKAEALEGLCASLDGSSPSKNMQGQSDAFLGTMKESAAMLRQTVGMLRADERAFSQSQINRFAVICDEVAAKCKAAGENAAGVTINGQPLPELISYAEINKEIAAYRRRKLAFDSSYSLDKYKEQLEKRKERHSGLMAKNEVVFLADNVHRDGSDLILSGRFYNGTADLVTGVVDMQVDLKLFLFDAEAGSITDVPCAVNISGLRLAPKETTDVIQLRLAGKAPEGDFSAFEENAHKIRWSRRKAA